MKFDGETLSPWSDFLRIIQNARSLTVTAAGKTYSGAFDLDIDDQGNVTIDVGGKAPKKGGK